MIHLKQIQGTVRNSPQSPNHCFSKPGTYASRSRLATTLKHFENIGDLKREVEALLSSLSPFQV